MKSKQDSFFCIPGHGVWHTWHNPGMYTECAETREFMDYRIGLDIGIASVGWAVLENNSQDEPVRIVDLGVRVFDKAEQPKTGDPLAGPRRDARSSRRRLRRRKHRLERIKWLFEREHLIDPAEFMQRYYKKNLPDVYELRYKALDQLLSDDEFAQVLLHIAKHRGFRSTRTSDRSSKEDGAVINATKENQKLFQEKGYRTIGEMIYLDEAFHEACDWNEKGYTISSRNKGGDYRHTIMRAMLVEEVHAIFAAQRELGNPKATESFEEAYLAIMESQRSFDLGPGLQADGTPSPYALEGFADRVGHCTLEPEELRAAKGTYTAEYFVALQKINQLRILDQNGCSRPGTDGFFTDEERSCLIELLHKKKEISYAAVRKELKIPTEYRFHTLNYSMDKKKGVIDSLSEIERIEKEEEECIKQTEKAKFVTMRYYHEYAKHLKERIASLERCEIMDLFDRIGWILTCYKNDDSRTVRLQELGLDADEIDSLLELTPVKFQHLSVKAMRNILPYLEEGLLYHDACEKAGYDFKAENKQDKKVLLHGKEITDIINEITNPVVKRSISQAVKVLNAIILRYGSPQAVNIELAREASKNFQERKKLESNMLQRQQENERYKKAITELLHREPKGQDIVKYRLWHEQGGRCMYSGKVIPFEHLFEPGYEVDHILPYSMTFDDSYHNKVLVCAQENQRKGNRIPYEYLGQNPERWAEYENRVKSQVRDNRKQKKLLKMQFTEEERKQFKERNLTDTKYITRVMYNMIRDYLKLAPYQHPEKKKQVWAVNGVITDYLKKRWGMPKKDRSIDTHHAMDAVVIACCTDGMIQKITRSMQAREISFSQGGSMFDELRGEMVNRDNYTRDEWDEMYGVKIPKPWDYITEELAIRMGEDPLGFIETHADVAVRLDYPEENYKYIRPIFVSRMPNHKVTGQAHDDTVRSMKYYKDGGSVFEQGGYVVTKTDLQSLKLDKDGEIKDYFNPDSDRLLYEALKKQLRMAGGDAKKAFAEPFHKPKADGSDGPLVRKVKLYSKMSGGVQLNGGKGIAGNNTMVRIDVFCENGKYYYVPIYAADIVKKRLPNKAVTRSKQYVGGKEMEDQNFIFSLYPKDLIHIRSKKELKLKRENKILPNIHEVYVYFSVANVSKGSIDGITHDKTYSLEGLGIQTLEIFEKCQVDILGNVSVVKSEKRMGFS